jgi:hypothetical protein
MAELSSNDLLNFGNVQENEPTVSTVQAIGEKPKRKYTPRKPKEEKQEQQPAIQLSPEQIAQMQGLVVSGIGFIWIGLTGLLAKALKNPRWQSDEAEATELAPYFKATLDVILPSLFNSPYAPTMLALTGYLGRRMDLFVMPKANDAIQA